MADPDWKPLKAIDEIKDKKIYEPWLCAVELVRDVSFLRIKAEGSWNPFPNVLTSCKPDGHAALQFSGGLVIADGAIGALIGRFGGSSAGFSTAVDSDRKPFCIGTYCVVAVPQKVFAPLFIGFNVLARPVEVQLLKLTVEAATPTL